MSHNFIQDALFDAKSVAQLDRTAIDSHGVPGIVLMKRAGRAALRELLDAFGVPTSLTIFCGSGNNAGDGYIVAALAAAKNIPVEIVELSNKLSADASEAKQFAQQAGVGFVDFDQATEVTSGVIVDGLLGTGFDGDLRQPLH